MIDEKIIMPFNYFSYGGTYTGQHENMHYMIRRVGEKPDFLFEGRVWEGPFASSVQPEEAFTTENFPFSAEGREACISWVRAQYEADPEKWKLK